MVPPTDRRRIKGGGDVVSIVPGRYRCRFGSGASQFCKRLGRKLFSMTSIMRSGWEEGRGGGFLESLSSTAEKKGGMISWMLG